MFSHCSLFLAFSHNSCELLYLYYASSDYHYAWTLHCFIGKSRVFQLSATKVVFSLFFSCLRLTLRYILKYWTWLSGSSIKHSTMQNGDKWCETSLEHTFILAPLILPNCLFFFLMDFIVGSIRRRNIHLFFRNNLFLFYLKTFYVVWHSHILVHCFYLHNN